MNLAFGTPLSHSALQRQAASYKKEVLERLLTARHCARRAPYLAKSFRKSGTEAWRRRQSAHLVGIGFGIKETKGNFTGALAVRVYVTRKFPKAKLARLYQVPEFVNGMPTDVIPVGRLKLQSLPAAIGAAISHVNGRSGSLGGVVSLTGDDGWFLLSASHVLAPSGNAVLGDQILGPSANEGTAPIASLTDFEPLKPNGASNLFDAAIARVIRKTDIALRIPPIGALRTDVMEPLLYQSVRKYGAATEDTLGIVTAAAIEAAFWTGGRKYLFNGVIEVTGCGGAFTAGGDSGALVVDALSNRPLGLVIGGAEPRTYTSPLGQVLTRFNARLVSDL